MKNPKVQIAVAVIVGLVLLVGAVFSIFVQDEKTILLLALLAVMYVIYLVRVIPLLKANRKEKAKSDSPLMRR